MKIFTSVFVLSLIVGAATAMAADPKSGTNAVPGTDKKSDPKAGATTAVKEVAVIKTTEGEMVIEFWPGRRPQDHREFQNPGKEGVL